MATTILTRGGATRQYARIVEKWIASIGLNPADYGTHSFRRTKASLIYWRTKNLRAVQLFLGHTKLESTVRYLGIEVDDVAILNRTHSLNYTKEGVYLNESRKTQNLYG